MKRILFALALVLALPAFAQVQPSTFNFYTDVDVTADSRGATPTGAPVGTAANPYYGRTEFHGNTAAQAGTVFVNPPSADTCAKAGTGGSIQVVGGGAALSVGGDESAKCDMRADAISLKVTTGDMELVMARYCMDKTMAEAFARAGKPCVDKRPKAAPTAQVYSSDPLIAARQKTQ